MDSRERFSRTMNYQKPDRLPFYQFIGLWSETINGWYGEGLPPRLSINDYLGFGKIESVPLDYVPLPRFIPKTLYEDKRHRIEVRNNGITAKVTSAKNIIH